MEIRVKQVWDGAVPKLVITYDEELKKILEEQYVKLGLKKHISRDLFGEGKVGEFWREDAYGTVLNYFRLSSRYIDDINMPGIDGDLRLNIAIFRAVPPVEFRLERFLTTDEMYGILEAIKDFIRRVLTITMEEWTITFKKR